MMISRQSDNRGNRLSNQTSSSDGRPQNKTQRSKNEQWTYLKIVLSRGKKGFGFAFSHNVSPKSKDKTITVTKIVKGGAAEEDDQLRIGDVIVSVNNVNFEDVPHSIAIETLKNLGTNLVMFVRRSQNEYSDINDDENFTHEKEVVGSNRVSYSKKLEPFVEDTEYERFEVTLTKGPENVFGLFLEDFYIDEEETDTYIAISKMTKGGVADLDGRIKIGDILLQIDDEPLEGVPLKEAVNLLKTSGRQCTLILNRLIKRQRRRIESDHSGED